MANENYVLPASRPQITELNITNFIRSGSGFVGSFSGATATNSNLKMCAFSLFNPSASGVSVIIYSILINSQTSSSGNNTVTVTTTDPKNTTGYTGTPASQNMYLGSSTTSAVSLSSTVTGATATVTSVGTVMDTFSTNSNTLVELLSNSAIYFLPSGLARGIAIFETVSTAGNVFGATVRWIEYSLS